MSSIYSTFNYDNDFTPTQFIFNTNTTNLRHVGIGTTVPNSFLQLKGNISAANLHIQDTSPLAIDVIAKKYPNLVIIYAHMGGHRIWDTCFCIRANANVYTDTSYFTEFFRGTQLEKDFVHILHKCDQKIIYGSDVSITVSLHI